MAAPIPPPCPAQRIAHMWKHFEAVWISVVAKVRYIEALGGHFGVQLSNIEACGSICEPSWSHVGRFGSQVGHLGAIWEPSWGILGHLGAKLEPS